MQITESVRHRRPRDPAADAGRLVRASGKEGKIIFPYDEIHLDFVVRAAQQLGDQIESTLTPILSGGVLYLMRDRYRVSYGAVARSGLIGISAALFTACLALSGQSQERAANNPPSSKRASAQQNTQPDQRGTPAQPLTVNIVPTEEQKEAAAQQEKDIKLKAIQDGKAVDYAGYAVLVGIVQFLVFLLQLGAFIAQARYMRRTVREMRTTTLGTLRAARAAGITAKASVKSADAGHAVELPALHVESITTSSTLDRFEGDYRKWFDRLVLHIKIVNYGRTPAFVTEVIVNATIDYLPPPGQFTRHHNYPKRFVIREGGADFTYTEHAYLNEKIFSDEQVALVAKNADYTGFLRVLGTIKYRDFLDQEHERRFMFLWIQANKDFSPLYNEGYHSQT